MFKQGRGLFNQPLPYNPSASNSNVDRHYLTSLASSQESSKHEIANVRGLRPSTLQSHQNSCSYLHCYPILVLHLYTCRSNTTLSSASSIYLSPTMLAFLFNTTIVSYTLHHSPQRKMLGLSAAASFLTSLGSGLTKLDRAVSLVGQQTRC